MTLRKLIGSKELIILGLNSGTSADGLDMAAVNIRRTGGRPQVTFLSGKKKKFSPRLREFIFRLSDSDRVNLDDIIYLDNMLGQFMGNTAASFIKELAGRKIKTDMITSHGQTIRHLPQMKKLAGYRINGTLQLGSLDQIAARTGKIVIGDFRQAEVAVGGEGAPITTGAMQRMLAGSKSRLIVNIGGVANYFYFPHAQSKLFPVSRDCGPGNSLCDILARKLYGKPYDKNGQLADKGKVSQQLLSLLQRQPFFTGSSVSTGREIFGPALVRQILDFGKNYSLANNDMIATTAEFTVTAIAQAIKPLLKKDNTLTKLYLTGGGRYNKFFIKRLAFHLPGCTIGLIDELGIDGDYVEAVAYAVMGDACLRSEILLEGKQRLKKQVASPILGHIVQPPVIGN